MSSKTFKNSVADQMEQWPLTSISNTGRFSVAGTIRSSESPPASVFQFMPALFQKHHKTVEKINERVCGGNICRHVWFRGFDTYKPFEKAYLECLFEDFRKKRKRTVFGVLR